LSAELSAGGGKRGGYWQGEQRCLLVLGTHFSEELEVEVVVEEEEREQTHTDTHTQMHPYSYL
jgi:hypothetical protein